MNLRQSATATTLAIAFVVAVPQSVGAGTPPFPTGVTIKHVVKENADLMKGRAFSDSTGCQTDRRIKILGRIGGPGYEFELFARGRTNERGRYRIRAQTKDGVWPDGDYFARAPATEKCLGDRSKRITIPDR